MRRPVRFLFRFCFLRNLGILAALTAVIGIVGTWAQGLADPPVLLTIYGRCYLFVTVFFLMIVGFQAGSVHLARALSFGARRKDCGLSLQIVAVLWFLAAFVAVQIILWVQRDWTRGFFDVYSSSTMWRVSPWLCPLLLLSCVLLGIAAGVLSIRGEALGFAVLGGTMLLEIGVAVALMMIVRNDEAQYVSLAWILTALNIASILLGEGILWWNLPRLSLR